MRASLLRLPSILTALGLFLLVAFAVTTARPAASAAADPVEVVNTPNVRLTGVSGDVVRSLRQVTPSFMRAKKRYAFIWNPGEAPQTYVVITVNDDGWVGVVTSNAPQPELVTVLDPRELLWLNVTRAFSIQEVIP